MATRYTCANPGCPRREPVTADAPPTCYTCGRAMIAVTDPRSGLLWDHDMPTGFDRINARLEPMRPTPVRSDFTAAALKHLFDDHKIADPVRSLHISLHDWILGDRVQLGPELSYPGYRRRRVDRGGDGEWPREATIDFPIGTATCTARIFGVSHSEDGDVLFWQEIGRPYIYIDPEVMPRLFLSGLGDLTVTMD